MISIQELHRRFMKDSPPVQLGGVASDLMRMANLAESGDVDSPVFNEVITETKFFTEWTAKNLKFEGQKRILVLQRTLARLVPQNQAPAKPAEIKKKAKWWSHELLILSGLLEETKSRKVRI